MATYKSDIIGSSLTVGEFTGTVDRAERKFIVRELTNPATVDETPDGEPWQGFDLKDAIDTVRLGEPQFHPQYGVDDPPGSPGLPLYYTRAYKIGATKALVSMQYRRIGAGGGGFTTPDSARARFRLETEYTEVYADTSEFDVFTGMPNGPVTNLADVKDSDVPPRPWRWDRPVARIQVQGISGPSHPFTAGIANLIRKVNDSGLTFGGFTLPIGSCRFDGAVVDVRDTATQTEFPTAYQFTVVRGLWKQQFVKYDSAIGEWVMYMEDRYESGPLSDIPGVGA